MTIERLWALRSLLIGTALAGFVVVNGFFVYLVLFQQETIAAGLKNGLALVFMGEAFGLMFFLAGLIHWMGWRRPGWVFFIAMSLLGSLAFSIPLQLYLHARSRMQSPTRGL